MDEVVIARPAGFWIRAVALVLDLALYLLVKMSFSRLARALWGSGYEGEASSAEGAVIFFTLLFAIVYTTTLNVVGGQTIGKALVGIRVVSAADGTLLTVGPALLRHLATFVSSFVGFGYLMAGLRRDKRALHDLLAGSRVEWLPRRRAIRRAVPRTPGPGLQDAAVAPAQPPVPAPDAGPGG